MPVKTTDDQRKQFYQKHESGTTYAEIAAAYGLSRECVRYWCRRQRKGTKGEASVKEAKRGLRSHFDPLVRYGILRLRLAHPRWGPSRLRYHLGKRVSTASKAVPSERQISRYLRQWPVFRRLRKRSRESHPRPHPAIRVHQRWQVDFKLGIPLTDGTQVNLHTVHDPVGAVCITACVTPAGKVGAKAQRVTVAELQATLRKGFCQWHTLPEEVQTDNEAVFVGNPTERFPSRFTRWLVGLGIRHLVIRPGKPTDNAEVERNHRTLNEYTLTGHEGCSVTPLQQILDQDWYELAFTLSSHALGCEGRPPVVAHPALLSQPRPFQPHLEVALFDLTRVDNYLAQFVWQRKVGKTGQVSLGGQHHYYSVGRPFANQIVCIRFDPTDRHLVFALADNPAQEIGRRPIRNLSVWDITGLTPAQPDYVPQQLLLPLRFLEE
jgi:transposase InsO family protein